MIGKILKYLMLTIAATLLVLGLVVTFYTIQYRRTVNKLPGLNVPVEAGEYGQMVDPFIGTGGFPTYTSGDDIPGATVPFGMVRLSPDTRFFLGADFYDENSISTAGYYYGDRHILGFSHTRMIGTGAFEGGHFRVMPVVGETGATLYRKGKYTLFSHDNEAAFPGYYAVDFDKEGILAELTATEHTGVHRYTFTGDDEPHILIDVSSALGKGQKTEGEVRLSAQTGEVSGAVRTFGSFAGRYGGLKAYFFARFSKPITAHKLWSGKQQFPGRDTLHANDLMVDLAFARGKGDTIELRMGISYVSIANAKENMETEAGTHTFGEVFASARQAWEDRLSLVKVEGGSVSQREIFYSALYRSLQMPTLFSDVNGDYPGFDKQVHKADSFRYFTDLSLWDTFRDIHPLFTLLAPKDQRDMMTSLVKMCEQGGVLPRWPSGGGYTGSMLGASADIVISEAWQKGIRGFDVETAYNAMKKAALGDLPDEGFKPRPGMDICLKFGYCPDDKMDRSVSKTLEYAYADDAVAKLAHALGKEEDAKLFSVHSQFYRNVWNPKTQYFQARDSSGKFVEKFDPLKLTYFDFKEKYTRGYVEGSALQWRWALFFDGPGLVSLFKSKEYFVNELNNFFAKSDSTRCTASPGSYYWHGNEPDIHAAYLFNYAGRPDLTQRWVRWVLDNKYGDGYDGIDGDDDAGTLSAWYVFSALGFYPVAGSDIYQLGAPLFPKANIRLGCQTLTIVADNYAPGNKFVKRIWLNGKPLDRFWIRHDEIARGGVLKFEMSEKPVIK